MSSPISSVWLVLGGIALWVLGQKMRGQASPGRAQSSSFGRLVSLVGLAGFCLGLYAGFMGPVKIGSTTIQAFSFTHFVQKSDDAAVAYAHSHLLLSRQPATTWQGASQRTLQYNVANNGDRSLSSLIVRLAVAGGSTIDRRVDGPFPARQTSIGVLNDVPANVERSYFTSSTVGSGEIVGASF